MLLKDVVCSSVIFRHARCNKASSFLYGEHQPLGDITMQCFSRSQRSHAAQHFPHLLTVEPSHGPIIRKMTPKNSLKRPGPNPMFTYEDRKPHEVLWDQTSNLEKISLRLTKPWIMPVLNSCL